MSNKKGIYFRVVRKIGKIFIKRKMLVDESVFKKRGVLIGHHQNFYGPIGAMLYMPDSVDTWVIDHLFNFKDCFDKYYNYTFKNKPRIIAFIPSVICGLLIPPLLKSANAIPVYRASREVIKTLDKSILSLEKNRQVLIFPDLDYTNTTGQMGEIYTGFLNINKKYHKVYNKHIEFIPIIFDKKTDLILSNEKITFSDDISFSEDKKRVENEIVKLINQKVYNQL